MKLLMIMNMMLSSTFLTLKHPLSMGMILILQTIVITMMVGMQTSTFWFSYILYLIMIGGLLILFTYMTSIASNEMFNFSKTSMTMIMATLIMMMILLMNNSTIILQQLDQSYMLMEINNQLNINQIYNFPNNSITIMTIIYLLVTLIAVIKISNIKSGPLRQKF
uniref:NADH-ubiquinone oxidoreductase chain 6 n=1 Tax=Rhysodes sp. BMNH-844233 TaxID=1909167 RepID=A0A343A4C8_9CARA|nr:NADH dehydrogenase subunit 6 [Rhysodes sp. BMNH-844233]